jgi:hypothetical protein
MSEPSWKRYDQARTKPRVNVVMSKVVRAMAVELAAKRGVSLSNLLEELVLEAYAKKDRRKP